MTDGKTISIGKILDVEFSEIISIGNYWIAVTLGDKSSKLRRSVVFVDKNK